MRVVHKEILSKRNYYDHRPETTKNTKTQRHKGGIQKISFVFLVPLCL